jgi:hypothetical protein
VYAYFINYQYITRNYCNIFDPYLLHICNISDPYLLHVCNIFEVYLLQTMKPSIHHTIARQITKRKKGSLVFPSDFRGAGSDGSIRIALARLEKNKKLIRLAHGIYMIPNPDPLLGNKYPSLEEIAHSIARRDHARIIPMGTSALHRLGLSTQIPMKLVYHTDGASRKVRIGKSSIQFKKTSPKKFSLKGKISSLIIQALEELGPKNLTPDILEKIRLLVEKEDPTIIEKDLRIAPAWIASLISDIKKVTK